MSRMAIKPYINSNSRHRIVTTICLLLSTSTKFDSISPNSISVDHYRIRINHDIISKCFCFSFGLKLHYSWTPLMPRNQCKSIITNYSLLNLNSRNNRSNSSFITKYHNYLTIRYRNYSSIITMPITNFHFECLSYKFDCYSSRRSRGSCLMLRQCISFSFRICFLPSFSQCIIIFCSYFIGTTSILPTSSSISNSSSHSLMYRQLQCQLFR
jgi:hypothetical protein